MQFIDKNVDLANLKLFADVNLLSKLVSLINEICKVSWKIL